MDSHKHQEEQLLSQFEPLLFKTLGRLNIRRVNADYDDFLQELRLKLLTIADKFDGDPYKEDVVRFLGFAKQGLYRYTIDLLKKSKPKADVVGSDVSQLSELLHSDLVFGINPEVQEFIGRASDVLSDKERRVFALLVEGGYTGQEMADELGVSRKTMNKYKKQIQEKLDPLKDILLFGVTLLCLNSFIGV